MMLVAEGTFAARDGGNLARLSATEGPESSRHRDSPGRRPQAGVTSAPGIGKRPVWLEQRERGGHR